MRGVIILLYVFDFFFWFGYYEIFVFDMKVSINSVSSRFFNEKKELKERR